MNGLLVEYQYIKEETGCRKIAKGREVFRSIYYDFNSIIEFPDGKRSLVLSQALNVWPDLRMHLSKVEIMWNLDHYFRHLYRIFKSNSGDGSFLFEKAANRYPAGWRLFRRSQERRTLK